MKSARPIKDEASAPGTGAQIVAPGDYPSKHATVTAEVLARLLAGERLTSLAAVGEASTTRLAAVVHYLGKHYGWDIEADERAAGCRDGRVSRICEYSLSADTIAAAMTGDAAEWCSKVHHARALLRTKATDAYGFAARLNRAGQLRPCTRRGGLLDGEGVQA